MGRWTPLILMAGGLAILLGTLLGTNFPLGGRSANLIQPKNQKSEVLPANITVNSTNGSASNPSTAIAPANTKVAQKPAVEEKGSSSQSKEAITTAQNTEPAASSARESGSAVSSAADSAPVSTSEAPSAASTIEQPVRALW